jgi:hypothetical protein
MRDMPPLEEGEHVLWESPARDKRLTFTIHGGNEFRITVGQWINSQSDPWLTKAEVREIVARIAVLAKL